MWLFMKLYVIDSKIIDQGIAAIRYINLISRVQPSYLLLSRRDGEQLR